jgi:hypothetical protein
MNTAGRQSLTCLLLPLIAAVLGLTLSASLLPQQAFAQNRGTPEQQQACQPDAVRLCSDFIPDVDRITACMIKNRMRLSAPCRAVFGSPPPKDKSSKPHNS